MTKLRNAFMVSAIGWAAALPLATYVASQPHLTGSRLGYALAIATYAIGSLVCHQRPERSFYLFGVPMPVCARCAGIYVGAASVSVVMALVRARRLTAAEGFGWANTLLVASATPIAITLLYEWTTGITPANWIRAASGLSLGGAVAWIVCALGSRDK